ncbi:hypothetical protein NVS89_16940 [Ancylobacter sp. MQZ15Z-1]|uniref:Uncharacterized protein n=1 Tax=Ancylobacter mangrovi TaxID=2972472 RepID=A0A9X2T306_9HYPH|nr:hypothetical protein [Ancylobacter mangrovi]MCS0496790.1 hypothetical protein [Ancylobacter mangrovi]
MTAEPFRATLSGDGIYFTWRPSLKKIFSAPRFKLVFLTFGVPTQTNGWRRHVAWLRFLFVCLLASEVHAMDERTYRYLRSHRFIRRKLHRAMPLVDVAFFETERAPSSFLLVVGDADRDEAVVDRLAESFDIVRVSTSKKSDGAREAANPWVRFLVGIDYEELKALYAGAAALIMPISTNRHAAGTTTVTEAVSAGCPVISNSISQV